MKNKKARQHIIGIRVDEALYTRLTIRALKNFTNVSQYCFNLIRNDVYRKRDKPLEINPTQSEEGK